MANDAIRYTEAMKDHPYGHALFVAEPSAALMPAACGYIDRLGRWAPVTYIDDPEQLAESGLSSPGTFLGASAIPAGFPASVKLALEFSSSSDFSGILHCPQTVFHDGYYHPSVFRDWAKENAESILQLVPDVKENGFWMVTDTYSTSDVYVTTWSGRDKTVQMGFDVAVTPVGEIGPSAEFHEGASSGEWHRTQAEGDDRLVVFFAGVKMKYRHLPFGWTSVKEDRGEEPLVVQDKDNIKYQVETEFVCSEPADSE